MYAVGDCVLFLLWLYPFRHADVTPFGVLQNTKDNPPCNTLFVGNLSESVLESELRGLFHRLVPFFSMLPLGCPRIVADISLGPLCLLSERYPSFQLSVESLNPVQDVVSSMLVLSHSPL